jgi:hypothetical protein
MTQEQSEPLGHSLTLQIEVSNGIPLFDPQFL